MKYSKTCGENTASNPETNPNLTLTLTLTLTFTRTLASPEFKLIRWGTRGVPGTFAPVMLVAVMLSVA